MAIDLHVLFRLKKGKKKQNGKCPLVIRITYQKLRKQISTKFKLTEKEWLLIEEDRKSNDEGLNAVKEFIKALRPKSTHFPTGWNWRIIFLWNPCLISEYTS